MVLYNFENSTQSALTVLVTMSKVNVKQTVTCPPLQTSAFQEVMRQAEKISQLESEKSLILQQMFEARSKNEPESNTSIFIW